MKTMLLGVALLAGCADRPLEVPAEEVERSDMTFACPVVPRDPTFDYPDNVCEIRGGCCAHSLDCAPGSQAWRCVDGRCCMPSEGWRREFSDAGGGP